MFTLLYNTVFPVIDRFFAYFSSIAMLPFDIALDFLLGNDPSLLSITAHGFTGAEFVFPAQTSTHFLSALTDWLASGLGRVLGVSDLPFFLAILVMFAETFVAVLVARFIARIVSGIM